MEGSRGDEVPPTASIQSLPQEVLLHVFSFLTPTELFNTVAKVCTQWEELHQDPSLYTALTFNHSDQTRSIVKCIKLAPWLKSLALEGNDFNAIFTAMFKHGVQVHKLSLYAGLNLEQQQHSIDWYYFLKVFKKYPKIHTLKLRGFQQLSASFYRAMSLTFSDLRVVHLIELRRLCYGTVLNITIRCQHLEEIRVHGNYYDDASTVVCLTDLEMMTLCHCLRDTLRVLHVDYTEWSARALDSLKFCRRLKDLGIYRASRMPSEFLLLIESFTLVKLKITGGRQPTENAWLHLIMCQNLKNLESIELKECSFTNKVAIAIGNNLQNLNTLALILIIQCFCLPDYRQVFSSGIRSIIKGCPKLKHLVMTCMDLDAQRDINLIPEYLPGLKQFCISPKVNPEPKVMAELKEKMPDLIISPYISSL